ncbi:helix-turn-helix domain-containing protein [Nocardioides sp. NPDC047086]|uniref:PucR family transcriptional regulator n=1 Tax=Nocardioides sp. NPDC047086 TaxID=3154810 RepID=UPI0033C5C6DE
MTRQDGRARLAAWADQNIARLAEEASARVADRITTYYRDRESGAVSLDELRQSFAHNLRSVVAAIGDPHAELDLEASARTGRRRARQAVPLPEVLQAYRICFATLWDALAEQVQVTRQPTDALIETAGVIWRFTDEHAVVLTEAYRATTAELMLAEQRRRSAVVEAVLTGRPGPESGPWEAAALLGFPTDALLIVVAAETNGLAKESLVNVEQRLAEKGFVSGWRLTPAQQLGIVSFPEEREEEVLETLRGFADARTGVSPPYAALPETPRALRLARAALAGLEPGSAGLRTFDHSPLAALVVYEPAEGRRLAENVLGEVLRQPAEDRELLLETLDMYLEQSGSAERAATLLYCHPNTVRNRLRRIQELTGRSLAEPMDVAELTAAAYALRVASATDLWATHGRKRPGTGPLRSRPSG